MEGSRRIKVFLNGEAVETFRGMKVKHILPHETVKDIREGNCVVTDAEGNERGLEGNLTDGESLKILLVGKSP